jgi:hypothetical protein
MVKQTNKKKHYKSYKFKTTMKRNKKLKRTHRKQVGGVINFPIYENASGEADVCPQLTVLNKKVRQLIDSQKKIPAASANNNKSTERKKPPPEYLKFKDLEKELLKINDVITRNTYTLEEDIVISQETIQKFNDMLTNDTVPRIEKKEISQKIKKIKQLIDQQMIEEALQNITQHPDYIEYKQYIESLKQKAIPSASASSADTIDISREDINSSLTLFDFQNILNRNCNDLYLKENVILIDKHGNHVTSNYPNQALDTHVFQITPVFQVKYLGKKQKTEYSLYTFESLYEEGDNYQSTKPEYYLNTLKYLQYMDVKEVFFNISPNEDIKLPNYEKLRDQFIIKSGQILLIRDNDNIVKNITFLNKMEEFIKLININDRGVNSLLKKNNNNNNNTNHIGVNTNHVGVNTNRGVMNTNVTFNEHYKRLIERLKLKLKESDIGNGIDIETKKFEKIEAILKTTFNDIATNKVLIEKYNKIYLLDFKLFLIEGENPLVLNLNFLKFLFNKLYNIDTLRSPFKDFLYTCILLKQSGFYDNIENLNEIKNAYIYIEFSSVLSRELIDFSTLKKKYITYISKAHNEQLLIFFDEMNNFIIELNSVKIEFETKNIDTKIIICLILRVYVFYLNKSYDKIRPISVKSHIAKYLKDATKDTRLEKIINLKFKILPQTTVIVETNNSGICSFVNCGERTLLNFFKYLLYDKTKEYITPENIDLLNDKYPANLLNTLFDELKKFTSEEAQFDYLLTKQNDFAKLMSKYSSKGSNKIMFAKLGKYEINPSFDNSKKMIFFLLSDKILPDTPSDDEFSQLLKIFGKEFKKNQDDNIIIDEFIEFSFKYNHAELKLINYKNISYYVIYDLLLHIIIEKLNFEDDFNQLFSGTYNNLKKIIFGSSFNQSLDGLTIPNIEEIKFGSSFNQSLDRLSIPNIKEITFGDGFNHLFSGTYNYLKKIILGHSFNQSLNELIIPNIEEITFGDGFNQLFSGTYNNLKKITFGDGFNQSLDGLSIPPENNVIIFIPYYNQYNEAFKKYEKYKANIRRIDNY